MNSTMFLFIALASLQIYGSEQNSVTVGKKRKADCLKEQATLSTVKSESVDILPKISLTKEEMRSPDKNKKRNDLLFNNQGCIVAIKAFLSDENETLQISMAHAALYSDAIALKNAINNNLLMKNKLLPQLTRCFPKDQSHFRIYRNIEESSLLHFACYSSKIFSSAERQAQYNAQQIAILKYFIKNGIDVNAQDNKGNTAMHDLLCRPYVHIDCLKILKKAGADINAQNAKGETPAFVAANNMNSNKHDENVELLEELVLYGADITIKNNKKESIRQILHKKYSEIYDFDHKIEIDKICKNLSA